MAKFLTLNPDTMGEISAGGGIFETAPERTVLRNAFFIAAAIFAVLAVAGIVGSYFYWQNLKTTPAYSLALIVDAAQRGDQQGVDDLVDTSAVVDDFLPQITSKAIDIYGRGLPSHTIERVAHVAAPVMPALKDKARAELPTLIRRKAGKFENVPFAGMVLGAEQYLDISYQGDVATIKSKLPGHRFDVTMQRAGKHWKIVGVNDDELAERIARAVGQEFIAAASTTKPGNVGERLGIKDLDQFLKNAEEALK